MLPLETELMPALEEGTVLRRTKPFPLATRMVKMEDKFREEVRLQRYYSSVVNCNGVLERGVALASVAEVIATRLKKRGCLEEETEEIMRSSLMYQRSLSVEDLLQLEDGLPAVRSLEPSNSVSFLAAQMSLAVMSGEGVWAYCVTPWEKMVVERHSAKFPTNWTSGLAFNPAGQLVSVSNIREAKPNLRWIRSYTYYLTFTGREICRELAGLMGLDGSQQPEYAIKDFVNADLR